MNRHRSAVSRQVEAGSLNLTSIMSLKDTYISSLEAIRILSIHPMSMQKLFRDGKLKGEKIANRWLIRRTDLEEFSKSYVPKVGRPRIKRKYTRRIQK